MNFSGHLLVVITYASMHPHLRMWHFTLKRLVFTRMPSLAQSVISASFFEGVITLNTTDWMHCEMKNKQRTCYVSHVVDLHLLGSHLSTSKRYWTTGLHVFCCIGFSQSIVLWLEKLIWHKIQFFSFQWVYFSNLLSLSTTQWVISLNLFIVP